LLFCFCDNYFNPRQRRRSQLCKQSNCDERVRVCVLGVVYVSSRIVRETNEKPQKSAVGGGGYGERRLLVLANRVAPHTQQVNL